MLLKGDTKGVIRIGIHGMGGVGKTTLAKAVYNEHHKRFQGSCFLSSVREVSRTEQDQVSLQKQLIADVLKRDDIKIRNVDQGIELIRARLCSIKVLLVIDDLDDPKLLEVLEGPFASGSITIITTRNEDMLDSINVQAKYKVNEMDDDQSRQLFAQHAFGDYKIPDKFTKLSQDILKRAGGLPLALKVFGSSMFNKREEEWRWFINKLNRVPLDDIDKKLLISFKDLKTIDPVLQNIFLDIACFYIGQKKKRVITIMETCYNTYVHLNIDILQKRCLITIDELGILGMHDLLRDMGREITRNSSPDEPEKHSRLWVQEDIDSVLKNHKGTEAIQGIITAGFNYRYKEVTFAAESFKKMSKLRFLYLHNVNLTGSFEQTFKDLRWLRWMQCPLKCLPFEFHPQKLVILELPYSKMRIWELNMVFEKLKTLDMRNSEDLTTTPDFTRLPCLETLNLSFCRSLKEVHISIGSLVRLVSLDLGWCSNLRSLPDSICSLRALEFLDISVCGKLEELPDQLGNIESLKVLQASGSSVSKLPDSIGRLSNLVELRLVYNRNLKTLPDSICNLRSLEVLDISECENLEELPDQLGKITSLRELDASGGLTYLKMIPDISQLSNIEDLDLGGCHSLVSIAELPPNLKKLKAGDCWSLERLPNLSNLKHLEELDLHHCRRLTEISSLEELTCLKRLEIGGCSSLEGILDVSNLKHLEELDLIDCTGFTEIHGFEELTSLRKLFLKGCNSSLLASILTKSYLEMWCGFQREVKIYIESEAFPNCITGSSKLRGSRLTIVSLDLQPNKYDIVSLDLQPNESHDILGIIFCFCEIDIGLSLWIKNMASGLTWSSSDYGDPDCWGSVIVIVPSSILPIRDHSHNNIEIGFDGEIPYGIHLVYKTEITKYDGSSLGSSDTENVEEDESNSENVEEERSHPSKR